MYVVDAVNRFGRKDILLFICVYMEMKGYLGVLYVEKVTNMKMDSEFI